MTNYLKDCSIPVCQAYGLALMDLDGVVYLGKKPVDYAADSIREAELAGMRFAYTTNNSSRFQQVVAEQLQSFGLKVKSGQIITSSVVAARMVASAMSTGDRLLVLGSEHLRQEVSRQGFVLVSSVEEEPQAVIQGWAPDLSWHELAEASYAIERGARYFVTNRDLTIPRELGVAPGAGSLIQAVVNASGVQPEGSAGKPESAMYDEIRVLASTDNRTPIPKKDCLAVGDRLDTDIEAGNRGGYDSLVVLTGVSGPIQLMMAKPIQRPSFIVQDLRGLNQPHILPKLQADGSWVCAGGRAWMEGDDIVVGDSTHIDDLRAAVCLAWQIDDGGGRLDPQRLPSFRLS